LATADESQSDLQMLALRADQLRQETETIQQQVLILQNSLQQLRAAEECLAELGGRQNSSSSVLLSVGGGYLVHSQIPSTDEVLTSIGSGVYKSCPLSEAIVRAKKQIEGHESRLTHLSSINAEKLVHLNSINREIESMLVRAQSSEE